MNTSFSSLICAPITQTQAAAFLSDLRAAAETADAIELRLDYLNDEARAQMLAELRFLAPQISKPLIFTFRPREQGGQRDLTLSERQAFWRSLAPELVAALTFADFELDLVESFAAAESPIPWSQVLCSWHNFVETPADLPARYEQMARTPAAAVKIATQAKRISDCLHIFEIIAQAQTAKPVIALGMGLPGLATRVLALSRGALLTFGALRRGAGSASGQPTVEELNQLYRAKQLTRASTIFGVIGQPVGHSRSPAIHNAALQAVHYDGVYLPLEVDDVAEFVRDFVRPATKRIDWRLRGLSVTIPHKMAVLPHLDFIDAAAQTIGAVNTVVVAGEELHGYNTDALGAMQPLAEVLDVRGARVAVLGAGGSARAVCYGLCQRGADVTIFARDLNKAQPLAEEFGAQTALLKSFTGQTDVVINCTPSGMKGHSEGETPVAAERLREVKLVYDLIYNPEETALLQAARQAGCQTLGGMAMLVAQAAEQFRLFTGLEASIEVMQRAARGQG